MTETLFEQFGGTYTKGAVKSYAQISLQTLAE